MNSTNKPIIYILLFMIVAMFLVFGTEIFKNNSSSSDDINGIPPIINDEEKNDFLPKEQVLEQIHNTGFYEIKSSVVEKYFSEIAESFTLVNDSIEFYLPKLTKEISWEIIANEIYYSDSLQGFTSKNIEIDYAPGGNNIVDISEVEISDLRFSFWIVGEKINSSRTLTITFSRNGDIEIHN